MRLGAYDCKIKQGSRTWEAYGRKTHIQERHRHRYEFNNRYLEEFEKNGMYSVGINPDANLVEIVEIPTLKWYIGTQFHPEYSSTVLKPHPLFMSFIRFSVDAKNADSAIRKLKRYIKAEVSVQEIKIIGYY